MASINAAALPSDGNNATCIAAPLASKDNQRKLEAGHYVVTSHRASSVSAALQCSFLGPETTDVLIVKACRLEIRQLISPEGGKLEVNGEQAEPSFPIVLDLPIRGRISNLLAFRPRGASTDFLFFSTERHKYAVISYDSLSKTTVTHDRGILDDVSVGREAECGPLAIIDPEMNCIAIHLYDGVVKFIPILPYRPKAAPIKHHLQSNISKQQQQQQQQGVAVLGDAFNATIDQQTLLSMAFLYDTPILISKGLLRLTLLFQDSRGFQQLITYVVDLKSRVLRPCHSNKGTSSVAKGAANAAASTSSTFSATVATSTSLQHQHQLNPSGPRKTRIDTGSCLIIPLPLLSLQHAASAATSAYNFNSVAAMEESTNSINGIGGGVLVVGQMQITHVSNTSGSAAKVLPIEPTIFLCFCSMPLPFSYSSSNGTCSTRFLLGDDRGYLFVLDVSRDERTGIVTGLHIETLGVTSIPSSIVYMESTSGLAFIGSRFGDSLLIRLHPMRDSETNSHVEIIEEFTNLGPIVDFDLVDFDGKGQCQVVTCSGAGKDGSIRVVRNGIGINEKAEVEIPGLRGIWNLRASFHDEFDKYLVQSFINETRILAITDDEMEETSIDGFISETATLYAANIMPNFFVQVTESKVVLVDCDSVCAASIWMPSDNTSRITVASGNSSGQLVIALRGGVLVYLTLEKSESGQFQFAIQATTKLDQEVSCINLNPLVDDDKPLPKQYSYMMDIDGANTNSSSTASYSRSKIVVVGLWNDFSVRVLGLDGGSFTSSLSELLRLDLGGDTQARSLMLATLEGTQCMLLVGLGDGQLISYFLQDDTEKIAVSSRKKVSLGTQSMSLCAFRNASQGNICIFASGDRPTVVYMNGGKLLYSNVNLNSESGRGSEEVVNWVCPFHCELFPDCLCLASEETLRIGTIDDIQKLHVQTFPIKDSPRRVAHHHTGRTFVVAAINNGSDGVSGSFNQGNVLYFLDDRSFEEIQCIHLEPYEMVLSLTSCDLQNCTEASLTRPLKSVVVVGTAFAFTDEDEPTRGRILVFETSSFPSSSADNSTSGLLGRSVRLLTEYHTNGGVYSMCPFGPGALIASVNSKTHIFRWHDSDGIAELKPDTAAHHGHIISLFVKSHKDLVLVGDLMRSISLLQYEDKNLEEVARDYNANWMTAVEILSDDVYLGAENWSNLFVLRRNVDATLEEVRCRLDTQGEYYLGEMVNKFARGSLVMRTGDDGNSHVTIGSKTLYCTVDGSIGCVLGLVASDFDFFRSLERCMANEVDGVGGFSHNEFRAFVAERRMHPSRGFVDGDLVESFLDLSRSRMECVVSKLNENGGWDQPDSSNEVLVDKSYAKVFTVEEVLMRVEEMSRLH